MSFKNVVVSLLFSIFCLLFILTLTFTVKTKGDIIMLGIFLFGQFAITLWYYFKGDK